MKNLKFKNEKGSIILFVLVSMLFFIIVSLSMFMMSKNKEKAMDAEIQEIKQSYGEGVDDPGNVYNTIVQND